MLAKDLGIHCYENRILTLASQMSGLEEKLFLDINERIRNNGGFTGFLKGLPRSRQYIARNEKFVSDDRLFEYQSQIIRNLADQEILCDRWKMCGLCSEGQKKCGQHLYRSSTCLLSGPYHAADEVSADVAAATIENTDKYRADYYKYYTKGNYWTNPVNYDMTLNSEKVGIAGCVKMIEEYLVMKGLITREQILSEQITKGEEKK